MDLRSLTSIDENSKKKEETTWKRPCHVYALNRGKARAAMIGFKNLRNIGIYGYQCIPAFQLVSLFHSIFNKKVSFYPKCLLKYMHSYKTYN